jgi:hypothetical protein
VARILTHEQKQLAFRLRGRGLRLVDIAREALHRADVGLMVREGRFRTGAPDEWAPRHGALGLGVRVLVEIVRLRYIGEGYFGSSGGRGLMTNLLAVESVGAGWKWLAILIAFAAVALLFGAVAISSRNGGLWKLIQGEDGAASTSKFQWLLWLIVVLFSYIALWILRARQGDYSAIPNVPKNVLIVLGVSTGTMVAAKGITSGYVASNRTAKQNRNADDLMGGIFADDAGYPEIAKIQIVGFTFVTVGIFLATVIHQIASNPPLTSLPDIDASLMVLMAISSGGYLAKKVVSITPAAGPAGAGPAGAGPAGAGPAGAGPAEPV